MQKDLRKLHWPVKGTLSLKNLLRFSLLFLQAHRNGSSRGFRVRFERRRNQKVSRGAQTACSGQRRIEKAPLVGRSVLHLHETLAVYRRRS